MSIIETPTRERLTSVTVSPRFPWQQAGPIFSRWTSHTSTLASACHGDYTYLPSADAVPQIWEFFCTELQSQQQVCREEISIYLYWQLNVEEIVRSCIICVKHKWPGACDCFFCLGSVFPFIIFTLSPDFHMIDLDILNEIYRLHYSFPAFVPFFLSVLNV